MKIILDTNVLISAFLTESGPSSQTFQKTGQGHILILSDYILQEFQEKMLNKLKWPKAEVDTALAYLKKRAVIVNPRQHTELKFSDPKDIPILQLALFCGAHYLITGDQKLLELKKVDSTTVINPREALGLL